MKYIVYNTINTVNGNYYIGVHKTEDPNIFDGYIGNGVNIFKSHTINSPKTRFQYAVKKYGFKSFIRCTLFIFDTAEEAFEMESKIVTKEFLQNPRVYNMVLGGTNCNTSKKVYQFDINGNLLKEWNSSTDILEYYNSKVSITSIVNNKRSYAGYYWSFENNINISEYNTEFNHGWISQYTLDGLLIKSYATTTLAAQQLDIPRERITYAVFNKRPLLGYYFIKSDLNIYDILENKFKHTANRSPIYRYNLDGSYDTRFSTTVEALRATPKAHQSALRNAVINGYKCGNYLWSYQKADNYFDLENPKKDTKPKKVAQYDLNNNLIKIWDNLKECKKEFPYYHRVCNGNLKTTQGYIFQYIN